jgi:glycine cleavage system aminomethyltransferase T
MKMGNLVGYRIALERADAGTRAAVRWARSHATLYDESFHSCVHLSGKDADLVRLLGITCPNNRILRNKQPL